MRILFSSIPTQSHIAPMLPLVASAVRAGHDVTFATGAEGIPLVALPGVHAVELGSTWAAAQAWYAQLTADPAYQPASPDEALVHYLVNMYGRYLGPRMAAAIVPFTATLKPDLVVAETGEFAGPTAALVAGVPFAVHGYGPQPAAAITPLVTAAIAAIHRSYGLDPSASTSWITAPYLDPWPRVLDDSSSSMFANPLPIRPAAVAPALPRHEVLDALPFQKTVYVTLGTMFNDTAAGRATLDKLIGVFETARLNAVVTVGRDGDLGRFARPADNIRIRDFVPQDAVIPYVDAVLSHGGAGTSLGALGHGVPHVMTPVASDQYRIAQKVADADAGIVLSPDASVDDIRTALHRVLSEESFDVAARAVGETLQAMPDADQALHQLLLAVGALSGAERA